MFNNLRKFLRVGISHNKQSLNSCFCSLITAFVLVSGAINIARADVCFLPDVQGCEQVPYEEYDSTAQTYPTDCYATKSEAMSARTDSMDSYYKTGDMWCIKSSCSGYNVTSMLPGGWNCQNCNDAKSKNYNKYKCSCNLEDVTPGIGYTIDLERCEEKPSACPSYASTDCVPDECHECNSINSANPVYSGGKECLIYSTVDEHCPDGYSTNEPAGGCYATQDMLCGEGKCYKAVDAPECGEGKRLVKANGVCSCVSECNANEYASEDVCKQNADECLQNDENNCWFARKFVQIYYLNDTYRDENTGIREPVVDECTRNEKLLVDGNECPNNRCKAYIGQTISIKYDTINNPNYSQCSYQYWLGKGRYEGILDNIYDEGGSNAVKLINDSIVMNDENIKAYGLGDFVRTKSVDWAYEDEDKWLGITKEEDFKEKATPEVFLSWTMFGTDGFLDENKPKFTEFYLWVDKIVDKENLIKTGWKIPDYIKIEITYERNYFLRDDFNYGDSNAYPYCTSAPFKEFNYIPAETKQCCHHDYDVICTKYNYSEDKYNSYVQDKVINFKNEHGFDLAWFRSVNESEDGGPWHDLGEPWVDTSNKNEITVVIIIHKDTIEVNKDSNEPRILSLADYIPDFYSYKKIKSVTYSIYGHGSSVSRKSADYEASLQGWSSDIGGYKITIKNSDFPIKYRLMTE